MNVRYSICTLALLLAVACGSNTPTTPNPPDTGPPVNNTPPVIGKFTVQGTRSNEPANFADASEAVPVTVEVTDAESQTSDLKFNWSSDAGTFSGNGPKITWTAPSSVSAPSIITLNLEVVETYTSQGKSVQNKVPSSTTLSLHDSAKEVSDMARQFLLDFSDSSMPVSLVMRNFHPDCEGTVAETAQVAQNRIDFRIIASKIGAAATTVQFGGICPYRSPQHRGDACAQVPSYWKSEFIRSFTDDQGTYHSKGEQTAVDGTDQVSAMYYRDQQRWRLCDSSYDGHYVNTLRPVLLRSLVP